MDLTDEPIPPLIVVVGDSKVLLRPLLAGAVTASLCAIIPTILTLTEQDGDRAAGAWFVAFTFLIIFLVVGVFISVTWWLLPSRVTYLIDSNGITVRRATKTLHSWPWREIDTVHVRGDMDWKTFAVTRGDRTQLPHLVIHSNGHRTDCPSVLMWGSERPQLLERDISTIRRALHQ